MNISDCNIRTYACMFVTRLISKKLNVVLFVIRARRGVGGVRLLRPLSRLQLLLQLAVLEGAGRGARARGAGRGRGARLAGALAVSITVARTAAALPPLSRRRRDVVSPRARTRPAGCYTMLARCALPKWSACCSVVFSLGSVQWLNLDFKRKFWSCAGKVSPGSTSAKTGSAGSRRCTLHR